MPRHRQALAVRGRDQKGRPPPRRGGGSGKGRGGEKGRIRGVPDYLKKKKNEFADVVIIDKSKCRQYLNDYCSLSIQSHKRLMKTFKTRIRVIESMLRYRYRCLLLYCT